MPIAECKMIEHRFSKEIIALLHHAHKHLIDGVETGAEGEGLTGCDTLFFRSLNSDTRLL